MSPEQQLNYEAILTDLETDKAELDMLIAYIKRKKLGRADEPMVGAAILGKSPIRRLVENYDAATLPSDAFFGLGLIDAAKKYLTMAKRPKGAREIATCLEQGGFHHSSKDFYNTVFSVLNREANKPDGEIVKVKKEWGLTEWYPGLRRGAKASKSPTEEALDTIPDSNCNDLI